MKVTPTALPGVLLIEPVVHRDPRGFFLESFNAPRFEASGLATKFVQDNHSRSTRGVLRGLHFQQNYPQGKLVTVVRGEVFDVAVDVRRGSPHFGKWVGVTLNADEPRFLYIPPGFAHGFCVTSDVADFTYKCTDVYRADDDRGVRWDDPDIGVQWPVKNPIVSSKDGAYLSLNADRADLPRFTA